MFDYNRAVDGKIELKRRKYRKEEEEWEREREGERERERGGFALVYLFYCISTLMRYIMPKFD